MSTGEYFIRRILAQNKGKNHETFSRKINTRELYSLLDEKTNLSQVRNGGDRWLWFLGHFKALLLVLWLERFARKRSRAQGAKTITLELSAHISVLCSYRLLV